MVVLYTLIALKTGSFTVVEHKTKILVACQMLHIYLSRVHSQISVFTNVHTVTININVTVHINKHLTVNLVFSSPCTSHAHWQSTIYGHRSNYNLLW